MQILMASRGAFWDIQRFFSELQGKYLALDFKGKQTACNIVYRPLQLGEVVFPETALQTILATLNVKNWKRENFLFDMVRKKLGYEKVPEYDGKTFPLPVWNKNIELNLIGLKKDLIQDGYEHL